MLRLQLHQHIVFHVFIKKNEMKQKKEKYYEKCIQKHLRDKWKKIQRERDNDK